MKKLLCFAFFMNFAFFGVSKANTETVTWMVDGVNYATTTCESGNDISLPNTPVKNGYTFIGWREVANRGTFSNWVNVPTSTNLYISDGQTYIPKEYDYMVVTDTSDFHGDYDKPMSFVVENIGGDAARPGYRYTFFENGVSIAVLTMPNRNSTQQRTQIRAGMYATLNRLSNAYITELKFYSDSDYSLPLEVKIDNNIVVQYDVTLVGTGNTKTVDLYYADDNSYSGAWRFVYMGNWETDGKTGWKPAEQLE